MYSLATNTARHSKQQIRKNAAQLELQDPTDDAQHYDGFRSSVQYVYERDAPSFAELPSAPEATSSVQLRDYLTESRFRPTEDVGVDRDQQRQQEERTPLTRETAVPTDTTALRPEDSTDLYLSQFLPNETEPSQSDDVDRHPLTTADTATSSVTPDLQEENSLPTDRYTPALSAAQENMVPSSTAEKTSLVSVKKTAEEGVSKEETQRPIRVSVTKIRAVPISVQRRNNPLGNNNHCYIGCQQEEEDTEPTGSNSMMDDDDLEAPSNPVQIVYCNDPDSQQQSEVRQKGNGDDEVYDWDEGAENEDPKGAFGAIQGCIRDRHIKHAVLYFCNAIYLGAWWHHLRTGDCSDSLDDECPFFWVEMPGFVLFLWLCLYLLFLYEFFKSSTAKYLRHINTTESILEYMQRLYATPPTITLTMECYHMETRVYTYTDSNGNLVTSTQTVPVVTYTETEGVDIVSWRDDSIPLKASLISEYKVTKVKLSKTFEGDDNYNLQVMSLIQRNQWRDVFYNLQVDYQIEDFHSRVLAFVNIDEKPGILSFSWCMLAHVTLFLSLPYRFWMSAITGKTKASVHKIIQTRLPSINERDKDETLSTPNSKERDVEVESQEANFVGGYRGKTSSSPVSPV